MNLPEFFGLDIGNHSVKLAQAQVKGEGSAKLTAVGQLETASSLLAATEESAKKALADKIKQAHDTAGISTKLVVCGLPESSIFSRLILLPDLPEDQLEQSLYYEAKQYLPIPPSEVQLDHIPITKKTIEGKDLIQALLVAAPKTVVNSYVDIIQRAGMELIALETETMATARTITFKNSVEGSILTIDFGAKGTDMSVVKDKTPIFSQSLGTGSDALTKALVADFGLDYAQAEQYKRTYGLLADQAEGKIAKALYPVMQIIINEINKTLNYFRAHLQESTPKKIYIVGDGAKLPGLAAYLNQNLGIETVVSDPVSELNLSSRVKNDITQISTVGFTVAVGLALKSE